MQAILVALRNAPRGCAARGMVDSPSDTARAPEFCKQNSILEVPTVSNKKECAKGEFMAKRDDYEQKTEALLLPIMERNGFELVDVEYVKEGSNYYLRAYIDKEGGITIDDCEAVSRELSDLLDVEDFIPEAYFLEISSPGLGRQLKKDKDFARSIGEDVEVKLYKPLNKQKEFEGELISFDEENIVLGISEEETMTIPRESIAMIKLAIHF